MRIAIGMATLALLGGCLDWRLQPIDDRDSPPIDSDPEAAADTCSPAADTDPIDSDAPLAETDLPAEDDCSDTAGDPTPRAWRWGVDNTVANAASSFPGQRPGDDCAFVSLPGDLDGDGIVDVVVGCPSHGPSDEGIAYFVLGGVPRARGLDLGCWPSIVGVDVGPMMQIAVAVSPGDLDGDALADVVLSPGTTNPAAPGGEYLFRGRTDPWPSGDVTLADANLDRSAWGGDSGPTTLERFGDFDGDGRDDWATTGATLLGELHVVSGVAATGLVSVPDASLSWVYGEDGTRTTQVEYQAWADLDGDAQTDVVARSGGWDVFWLLPGSSAGAGGQPVQNAATTTMRVEETASGYSTLDDIDGDGLSELEVSAAAGPRLGTHVFLGGTWAVELALDDADVVVGRGTPTTDVTSVGDIDGDGRWDLAYSGAESGTSEAWVVLGRPSWASASTPAEADVHLQREVGSDLDMTVGHRLVGDIDGDGTDELFASMPNEDVGGDSNAGVVAVFRGTASWPAEIVTSDAEVRFVGSDRFQRLGTGGLSAVGDVDGDGLDDLLSGSTATDPGELYVFFGQPY